MANESEPAERKAKPEDGPRTVVVAEDEAVNRMDLVAMLEDNGYEVVGQAANGEEAVELTASTALMWCAWMSRCRVWTASPLPGIICDENIAPVVMLTAFSQTDLVKKATGAGAMHTSPSRTRNPSCCRLEWPWPFRRDQRFAGQRGAQRT